MGRIKNILHPKILLELYSTNDLDLIIDLVSANSISAEDIIDKQELIFIMLSILGESTKFNLSNSNENDNVFDDRQYLSLFVKERINQSIKDEKNDFFLVYSTLSINEQRMERNSPRASETDFNRYLSYENGNLLKEIMIEIFENYNIL